MKKKQEKRKKTNIVKIILIVVGVLLALAIIASLYFTNLFHKMDEKITIKNENITLRVKSIDTYTNEKNNENSIQLSSEGNFYKVGIEITNNGNEVYTINSNFALFDKEKNKINPDILSPFPEDNILGDEILPNQTKSGYIYFKKELKNDIEANYLTYYSYNGSKATGYSVLFEND